MRTAMIHHPNLALDIAKGNQLLAQQHNAHRRAARHQLRGFSWAKGLFLVNGTRRTL
jgi:hypothetical protein